MLFDTGVSYMLTYIVTALFAFSGVYVGSFLAFISPEELKPGKQYFKALANSILVFLTLILLYSYGANLFILILLGLSTTIFLYFTSDTIPINQIAYFSMGAGLFFATASKDLFIIISSMIFIYDLPLGSLFVERHANLDKKTVFSDVLLNYGLFVIIALMTNLFALYITNM